MIEFFPSGFCSVGIFNISTGMFSWWHFSGCNFFFKIVYKTQRVQFHQKSNFKEYFHHKSVEPLSSDISDDINSSENLNFDLYLITFSQIFLDKNIF